MSLSGYDQVVQEASQGLIDATALHLIPSIETHNHVHEDSAEDISSMGHYLDGVAEMVKIWDEATKGATTANPAKALDAFYDFSQFIAKLRLVLTKGGFLP